MIDHITLLAYLGLYYRYVLLTSHNVALFYREKRITINTGACHDG